MKKKDEPTELVIQFVGRNESGELAEAPTRRVNGKKTIDLPSDEVQKKGFSHDDAQFLLNNYPKEFKVKTAKGK